MSDAGRKPCLGRAYWFGLGVLLWCLPGCGPGAKSKPAARPGPTPEEKPFTQPRRPGGAAPAADDEHVRAGKAALKQNRYGAALGHFERAVKARPKDARAHYYRGVCLQHLRKTDQAVEAYRKAMSLKPDFPEKYLNLAGLLLLGRKWSEAEKILERGVRLFRRDDSLWHNLGLSRLWSGRFVKAAYAFEQAATISPGEAEYPVAAGLCYLKANRPQTALARFESAMKVSQASSAAHEGAAQALLLLKRYDEALKYGRKAVKLKPEKAALHHLVGVVLLQMGKAVEAQAAFRAALGRAPKSASVHMRLGQALTLSGEPRKAVPLLLKAAALAGAARPRLRSSIDFLLAEAYRTSKRCRKAVPLYRKTLKDRTVSAERKAEILNGLKKCGVRRP